MSKIQQEQLEALAEIRDLMKRSTRFLSLSGLSSVFAGIFALLGAGVAFWYLHLNFSVRNYYQYATDPAGKMRSDFVVFFFADALIVLVLSIVVGYYFSWRKAQKYQLPMWDSTTYRMVEALFVPLAIGGLFCLALLAQSKFGFIAPSTLIFYGLALINASKYTLKEMYYLGISQASLGVLAAFMIGYGLIFWALGFGVLHILYGWLMYNRYERGK